MSKEMYVICVVSLFGFYCVWKSSRDLQSALVAALITPLGAFVIWAISLSPLFFLQRMEIIEGFEISPHVLIILLVIATIITVPAIFKTDYQKAFPNGVSYVFNFVYKLGFPLWIMILISTAVWVLIYEYLGLKSASTNIAEFLSGLSLGELGYLVAVVAAGVVSTVFFFKKKSYFWGVATLFGMLNIFANTILWLLEK